jgi:hypothetical protein
MTRKQLKKMMIGLALATACAGFITACGSDDTTQQGRIVKGPVSGATVFDALGTAVGTTDANGNFPMTGTAPYHTGNAAGTAVLGTYLPILKDGTLGAPQSSPPLQGYNSFSQVSPLSTIVSATPTLADKFVALGIDLNADLSKRTTDNSAAFTLAETVGAVLSATYKVSGAANYALAKAGLGSSLAAQLPATPALFAAMTPSAIATAVTAALTAGAPTVLVAVPTLGTIISDAATGAAAFPVNTPIPTPSGATGGTGGTGTGTGF